MPSSPFSPQAHLIFSPNSFGAWNLGAHRNFTTCLYNPCALCSSSPSTAYSWKTSRISTHCYRLSLALICHCSMSGETYADAFHGSSHSSVCAFTLLSPFPITHSILFLSVQPTQETPDHNNRLLTRPHRPRFSPEKVAVIYLLMPVSRWQLDSRLSPLSLW